MRETREPSINLGQIFGRVLAAKYKMPLKHIAFQNMYAYNEMYSENILLEIIDPETIESFTMISSFGGVDDSADFSFVDDSWKRASTSLTTPNMRMLRGDKVSNMHCGMLRGFSNLERYFLVTGQNVLDPPFPRQLEGSESNDVGTSSASTGDSRTLAETTSCGGSYWHAKPSTPPAESTPTIRLQHEYLETITKFHGAKLRHLLLLPQWRLSKEELVKLVRSCPKLEQLGLALKVSSYNMLRLLIPFLPKLYAVRLLEQTCEVGDDWQESTISETMDNSEFDTVSSFVPGFFVSLLVSMTFSTNGE